MFVTFVPERGEFICHPLHVLERHSEFLHVPHEFLVIDPSEGIAAYERAFRYLQARYGVTRVITGDILSGEGIPERYWLYQLLCRLGLQFSAPLSDQFAEDILDLIGKYELDVLVTGLCASFQQHQILGRKLSLRLLRDTPLFYNADFDICGERGEYHTCVMRYRDFVFCDVESAALAPIRCGEICALGWSRDWLKLVSPRLQIRSLPS
jgi:diphthamide synthase (EF-2-diphthine--ammonia ligase)